MQWLYLDPGHPSRQPSAFPAVDSELFRIVCRELAQLDEDSRPVAPDARTVARARRIPQVVSGRVASVFVTKLAMEHQYFLTTAVLMRRKIAVCCVADERRGATDFVSNTVKHHSLDARRRRRHPLVLVRRHHGALAEVCTQAHAALLIVLSEAFLYNGLQACEPTFVSKCERAVIVRTAQARP
jgi:hypothetical protein